MCDLTLGEQPEEEFLIFIHVLIESTFDAIFKFSNTYISSMVDFFKQSLAVIQNNA